MESAGPRRALSRYVVRQGAPPADQVHSVQPSLDRESQAVRLAAGKALARTAFVQQPNPPGEHDPGADRTGSCESVPEGKCAGSDPPASRKGPLRRAHAGFEAAAE